MRCFEKGKASGRSTSAPASKSRPNKEKFTKEYESMTNKKKMGFQDALHA